MTELLEYYLYFARATVIECAVVLLGLWLVGMCAASWRTSNQDRSLLDRNGGDPYAYREVRRGLRSATGRGAIGAIFLSLGVASLFAEARIPPSVLSVAGLVLLTFALAILTYLELADRRDRALNLADVMAIRRAREANAAGIIALDRYSTILWFNAAAARIFGYEAEEVLGKSMTELMPESFRDAHLRGMARAYASTTPGPRIGPVLDLPGLRKDGSEVPLHIVLHEALGTVGKFYVAFFTEEVAGRGDGPRDASELRHDAQMAAIEHGNTQQMAVIEHGNTQQLAAIKEGTEASKEAQHTANTMNEKIAGAATMAGQKANELRDLMLDRFDNTQVREGARDVREGARDIREGARDIREGARDIREGVRDEVAASQPTPTESLAEILHNTNVTEDTRRIAGEVERQTRKDRGEDRGR